MGMNNIKAFMIDLDGVVYFGDKLADGAIDTVSFLRKNYKCLFVTNTTRTTRKGVVNKLLNLGIRVNEENVLTALSATIDYIKSKKKNAKCFVIGSVESRNEFVNNGLELDDKNPDFVVIGLDRNLNFNVLNKAFRLLINGANFVAMHEDRFAPMEDGLTLSVGPFVRALEYASGRKALSIGKPNENFFRLALIKLRTKPEETAMIGDDIESDIAGAKNVGMKGIFIRNNSQQRIRIKPDLILDSISELPRFLK